jgi:hypothetical protein
VREGLDLQADRPEQSAERPRTARSSSMTYTTDWGPDRSTIRMFRKIGGKVPYSADQNPPTIERADHISFPMSAVESKL